LTSSSITGKKQVEINKSSQQTLQPTTTNSLAAAMQFERVVKILNLMTRQDVGLEVMRACLEGSKEFISWNQVVELLSRFSGEMKMKALKFLLFHRECLSQEIKNDPLIIPQILRAFLMEFGRAKALNYIVSRHGNMVGNLTFAEVGILLNEVIDDDEKAEMLTCLLSNDRVIVLQEAFQIVCILRRFSSKDTKMTILSILLSPRYTNIGKILTKCEFEILVREKFSPPMELIEMFKRTLPDFQSLIADLESAYKLSEQKETKTQVVPWEVYYPGKLGHTCKFSSTPEIETLLIIFDNNVDDTITIEKPRKTASFGIAVGKGRVVLNGTTVSGKRIVDINHCKINSSLFEFNVDDNGNTVKMSIKFN
jgi:hypothetical protein